MTTTAPGLRTSGRYQIVRGWAPGDRSFASGLPHTRDRACPRIRQSVSAKSRLAPLGENATITSSRGEFSNDPDGCEILRACLHLSRRERVAGARSEAALRRV